MALLQKTLRGYTDFIGRFRGGQVGMADVELLQPVIAMEDFINERKNDAFSTTLTAANQFASFEVPAGKRWRIHSAYASFAAAAGQATLYSVMIRKNFGAAAFFGYTGERNRISSASGSYNRVAEENGVGFNNMDVILDSSDEIGVIMSYIDAGVGNFDYDFFVQYTEWAV